MFVSHYYNLLLAMSGLDQTPEVRVVVGCPSEKEEVIEFCLNDHNSHEEVNDHEEENAHERNRNDPVDPESEEEIDRELSCCAGILEEDFENEIALKKDFWNVNEDANHFVEENDLE